MKKFFYLLLLCGSFLFGDKPTQNSEDQIIIKKLNGLVFYSEQDSVELNGNLNFGGLKTENITIPEEQDFICLMKNYLGKPVTQKVLQDIREEIVEYFKKHNYSFVVVSMPPGQNITTGVLRILILQGKLGKVEVCGANYYSNEKMKKQITTKPGEIINCTKMFEDLIWINGNPYLDTQLIYKPGEQTGYTDVLLQTCERFPLNIYGGYENTGNIIGGNSRYFVGGNLGNLFSLDHELRYLFISASSASRWYSHTGAYTYRFENRHILEANGAYTFATPEKVLTDAKGRGWRVSGRYFIPCNYHSFESDFFFGYEFKRTNNFLSFADTLIFNKLFDISQFLFGYRGKKSFFCGQTAFGVTLFLSPGNMTTYNKTEIFELERPGAQSDYFYGEIFLDHYAEFWKGFSWVLNMKAQYSFQKLLPLEEFSLGGFYTVRGYDENEVIGDNGVLIKNEIRMRPWSFHKKTCSKLQPLAFVDFGVISDADKNIISENSTILASIGMGLRLIFDTHLIGRVDYGYQLHQIDRLVDESNSNGRFHVSMSINF